MSTSSSYRPCQCGFDCSYLGDPLGPCWGQVNMAEEWWDEDGGLTQVHACAAHACVWAISYAPYLPEAQARPGNLAAARAQEVGRLRGEGALPELPK